MSTGQPHCHVVSLADYQPRSDGYATRQAADACRTQYDGLRGGPYAVSPCKNPSSKMAGEAPAGTPRTNPDALRRAGICPHCYPGD